MLRLRVSPVGDAEAGADSPPSWMSDAECLRWRALAETGRSAFAASRWLLRCVLQEATGHAPAHWQVSAEVGAAPVLRRADGDARTSGAETFASLSHRLGWLAVAVSDAAVGVDIEVSRQPRSDPAERAALMLAPGELCDWRALAADARESALLARWTAKEAWFKAVPRDAAPWDFRQLTARACAPCQANVRVWKSPPLSVAVCTADPVELAAVECQGIDAATATSVFWHVARAAEN